MPFHVRIASRFIHHTVGRLMSYSTASSTDKTKRWAKTVSNAEKIVGYPTSFMNLRFWLSDEMSNVAVNMRKLIGSRHPLMTTAKGLLFESNENMQTRGLIVLLMSKAGGTPESPRLFEHHKLDTLYKDGVRVDNDTVINRGGNGILETQHSLAEITEMIHTAFILHKGVMNIDTKESSNLADHEDYVFGNKMALLSGDYLLAKASSGLAALGNTYVAEIMASAICDLMESMMLVEDIKDLARDEQWEKLTYKSGGCLYAKSCQSALMLSCHPEELSNAAFNFGKKFAFLRYLRLQETQGEQNDTDQVLPSASNLAECKFRYTNEALLELYKFPKSAARDALQALVQTL